jgi:outer membrane lipoprotein-sorting protein
LITYKNKSMSKMTQWISENLNYPIKMVYHSSYGDMHTEYKNINEGRVKDSVFEIPKGYKKMTMPGMGGQMQRMPQQ